MADTSRGNGQGLTPGQQRDVYSTTDLPLMAFYIMRGLELVKAERNRNGSNMIYWYRDPEGRAEDLRVEWINSECRDFDNAMRNLRKLGNEAKGRGRGRRRRHYEQPTQ
jgi:hypothetical protein